MKKFTHSTTIYLPRKFNIERKRAVEVLSEYLYGGTGTHGKVSRFYNDLALDKLIEAGLFNKDGEPILEKINSLEKRTKKFVPLEERTKMLKEDLKEKEKEDGVGAGV